jgi:hypothetical protein
MNSFEASKYPPKNPSISAQHVLFPKNGNKKTVSFGPAQIHKNTKVCMLSITENIGGQGTSERLWYTFDGSVPRPNNGHKMTSKSIIRLSPEAVRVARFSNQPGQQAGNFRLRMDQLS